MGVTTDRSDPRLQTIKNDGQQEAYLVLSEEERAKGFMRPVRRSYIHAACGAHTRMGDALAETYARQPDFYTGTYCASCHAHFPLVSQDGTHAFVWAEDGTPVGT